MRLNFIKASPSQNMTAFITDYVASSMYVPVANMLMDYEYLHVEQVGFIVGPKEKEAVLRLEMSGGEFCGNALLSAAAYSVHKGLTNKDAFLLETTGSEKALACHVIRQGANLYEAKAEMPEALAEKEIKINVDDQEIIGKLIQLDGISHFVTDFWPSKADYAVILEALNEQVTDKAIGIIPYKDVKENEYEIAPFVYVTETGSKIFERACGSGTLALGIHLAKQNKASCLHVHQPGGIVKVNTGNKNYISTNVRFTCEGFVDLDL